eukprot:GHVL01037272.1.p1 GENE.GHVL01037272.1~~GHVL01037272.1.p1  ORF type:complete len:124 (+),score=21.72 GHVL01037272.1:45-374(+)
MKPIITVKDSILAYLIWHSQGGCEQEWALINNSVTKPKILIKALHYEPIVESVKTNVLVDALHQLTKNDPWGFHSVTFSDFILVVNSKIDEIDIDWSLWNAEGDLLFDN